MPQYFLENILKYKDLLYVSNCMVCDFYMKFKNYNIVFRTCIPIHGKVYWM